MKVTLNGLTFPDFNLTFNFSGTVADVDAVLGKAVTQDSTSAETVTLAGDDTAIVGSMFMYEDRTSQGGGKVATVSTRGGMKLPLKSGDTAAIGDMVVGAGNGEVRKKLTDDTAEGLRVWAVDTTSVTVLL